MSRPLTVLLVEDDNTICEKILAEADGTEDVTVVDTTNDSQHALKLLEEYLPDAVILDLDLSNGRGNGFEFLQKLKGLSLSITPYILVTTNISSPITQNFTKDLGADFIFYKHQKDYREKTAVDFLRMMRPLILGKQQHDNLSGTFSETPAQKNQRLKRLISTELDYIGINPKCVGYQYLIDSILLIINENHSNIPALVAQKHKKTTASVERGMQNAISRAWRNTDIDELLLHYTAKINPDRGIPTLTEFIYYYANKIKNKC